MSDDLQERLARYLYDNDDMRETSWPNWDDMSDQGSRAWGHEPGKDYYRDQAGGLLREIGKTHKLVDRAGPGGSEID